MKLWSHVLCTLLCIFIFGFTQAQQIPITVYPAGSRKIDMQQFAWQYNDSATLASIHFTLINHANLPVKRIQLSIVARDKSGLTLQHKTTTVRQLRQDVTVDPEEQQTVHFDHAFRSRNIADIYVREVIAEFSNGSLEIIQQ